MMNKLTSVLGLKHKNTSSRVSTFLSTLNFPAYLIDRCFNALTWNTHVCDVYPFMKFDEKIRHCPCVDLLTIAQGVQMLQSTADSNVWTVVVQERNLSQSGWSPSRQPQLIDETSTKLRCKAVVHTRMSYDIEVAGGVFRSFELTFLPVTDSDLIMVFQHDVTVRVMQNLALFRLVDLNMGLLAQIYPSRFIHDILGAGERRNSLSFSPDDCQKYCEFHENIVILFADIVGFTKLCKVMQPLEIMDLLTLLYESNDKTLQQFPSLSKLEVVGDCYIAVGGLMKKETSTGADASNSSTASNDMVGTAVQMLDFALALLDIADSVKTPCDRLQLRIGIHCGPVTSGIIGRTSCKFMLFGDAMNTASRMESTCPDGKIQTSEDFHSLVASRPGWRRTNGVAVKGKGEMTTYVHDESLLSRPVRSDDVTSRSLPVFDSLQQYPYASHSADNRHPSWRVNLDMMLPTDV